MRLGTSNRFPLSTKRIREKYPKATTVQVRFVTASGSVAEFEGLLLSEQFERVLASVKMIARRDGRKL